MEGEKERRTREEERIKVVYAPAPAPSECDPYAQQTFICINVHRERDCEPPQNSREPPPGSAWLSETCCAPVTKKQVSAFPQ